jgi:hypothetical protein
MTTKNFVVKNGITTGNITLDAATGNLVATNANLGNLATANFIAGNANALFNIQGANVVGTVGNANMSAYAGNVTVAAQPNITSVGSLTSLTVTGNANVGNLGTGGLIVATGNVSGGNLTTGGEVVATGNVSGGNLTTGGVLSVTGNANVGNLGAAAGVFTANVSAGNLSTGGVLSVTGNANVGNLGTGGLITATGNVSGGNLTTAGALSVTGNANVGNLGAAAGSFTTTLSVTGNANVGNLGTTSLVATGGGSFGANLNMAANWINNVGYPVLTTDAASKAYVDTLVSTGIAYHQPVNVATTTTLATATGGTITYNNGASGVGANLVTTGAFLLIDGANVQTVGTRILVKDEANAAFNGIYTYANTTTIVRSTDADEYGPDSTEQFSINDYFFTLGGVVNEGTAFIVSAPAGTITFGTSNITFSVFSTSQVYDAGTGITITGTTISVNANQSQVTTVGTLGSLAVTGNANVGNLTTAGYVSAGSLNVSGTSNLGPIGNVRISGGTIGQVIQTDGVGNLSFATISTSGVSNGTSSVTIPNVNGNINLTSAGNTTMVVTGTGANITGTANISGNANVGNLGTGGLITATGNVTGANLITAGNIFAPAIVQNASTYDTRVELGTATGIIAVTTNGNSTQFTPSGVINLSGASQIKGGTFSGSYLTLGASQTDLVQERGGNVTVQVGTGGTIANTWTFAQNGSFTSPGNISTTANANVGNLNTAQILASANITTPQFISNVATGTAPLVVTSTTQVANLSVATAGSATTAGTVTTNAQPNITSVGTLTSLEVTGNVTAGNVYANSGTIGANLLTGTLTTAAQPNVTSVGTLANLVVTGNVTTGNVLLNGGLQSNRTNVSVTTNTVIDQFSPSTFRTAKYIISASSANGYQSVEALLVQDGANSYITIYGSVCSNAVADIVDISSNINGVSGNVALYATSSGGTATVNLITTYLLT